MIARLRLGTLVMTQGVDAFVSSADAGWEWLWDCIGRHAAGDDTGLDPEDQAANQHARAHGGRVLNAYPAPAGAPADQLWIITEADRSCTTALWPDEY